jgi:hypothetical protein
MDKLVQEAQRCDFKTGDIELALAAGCVGRAAATEYLAYATMRARCPDISEVIEDPEGCRIPKEVDVLYAFGLELVQYAKKYEGDDGHDLLPSPQGIWAYARRWPEEPQALLTKQLIDACPSLVVSLGAQGKVGSQKTKDGWEVVMVDKPETRVIVMAKDLPCVVCGSKNCHDGNHVFAHAQLVDTFGNPPSMADLENFRRVRQSYSRAVGRPDYLPEGVEV